MIDIMLENEQLDPKIFWEMDNDDIGSTFKKYKE